MELRQLTTDHERQTFGKCLTEARATRGLGFRETSQSQLGRLHLMFGNLYAIFEDESDPVERMLGGFIMHDLASFPQSFPRPELGHLPPRSVIEGSELWSLSNGMARIAAGAAAAVAGLLQSKAIVLYPILKPVDLGGPYAKLGFVKACEPVRWPYAETIDGGEIWVQPLIIEGEALERYVRSGFDFLFRSEGNRRTLHFDRQVSASTNGRNGNLTPHAAEQTAAS
jgi:hypothetical protein